MRGMIALVTVMTLLLFIGLGLLVYGIATNASLKPKHETLKEITLPSVGSIQMMSAWRGGLALYVVSPKGDAIYFVDPDDSKQLRIDVKREK
jgi:hypothetical protein